MDVIGDLVIPTRPPKYWVEAKKRLGFSEAALGRVWYHTYTPERRLQAWMAAPAAEWNANGCHKPG